MADPRPPLPGDTLFERRNAFLDLLLGLISFSEQTVSTVAELAEPSVPEPRQPKHIPPSAGALLR